MWRLSLRMGMYLIKLSLWVYFQYFLSLNSAKPLTVHFNKASVNLQFYRHAFIPLSDLCCWRKWCLWWTNKHTKEDSLSSKAARLAIGKPAMRIRDTLSTQVKEPWHIWPKEHRWLSGPTTIKLRTMVTLWSSKSAKMHFFLSVSNIHPYWTNQPN